MAEHGLARPAAAPAGCRAGRVHRRVRDAVAAAEIQLGELDGVLLLHHGQEAQKFLRRQGEAVGFEDLRADVAVQSEQFDAGIARGRCHGFLGC